MLSSKEEIYLTRGDELKGKRIALCVTGSISAYKSVDLARELIRHGADVYPVISSSAKELVSPELFRWATGNEPITELTGKIEHVALTSGKESSDIVVVAPATANTISKVANGISDTTVTTLVCSALGSGIKVVIAPAMHDTMLRNRIVQENIQKLRDAGVVFVEPKYEEGKAKLAEVSEIVEVVISCLSKKDLSGKNFLITGGATVEYIDPVRVITNMSSGKTAVEIAKEASRRGANVTLIYAYGTASLPHGVKTERVKTAKDMLESVLKHISSSDVFISVAAVTDYRPDKKLDYKISTRETKELAINLIPVDKVIQKAREQNAKSFIVGFKAEYSVDESTLIKRARELIEETKANAVIANDVSKQGLGFGSDMNEVYFVTKKEYKHFGPATKREIARFIIDNLVLELGNVS